VAIERANNLGLLRLLFAALVIVSHSFEMLDGDRSRELATRLWGTLSFGEIAVDGFFLVSGYLITHSFLGSSTRDYLAKRALRIYPAFLVACAVLVLAVAPLAGARPLGVEDALGAAWNALTLETPDGRGAFAGLPYPTLDGAMWTIRYEFDCYLAVIALGLTGFLRRPIWLAAICAVLLLINGLAIAPPWTVPYVPEFGFLPYDVRLAGVFMVGMLYYLLRDRIRLQGRWALAAAVALFVLMFFKPVAEAALAILGGYLVFWLARVEVLKPLSARLQDDVSYGLYLYAWPVSNLLIYYGVTRSPWLLMALTLILAAICGYLSWRLVERPMLRLKPGTSRLPRETAPAHPVSDPGR
jgi:peptidoglycan/LPS O-acetylase OafA/YrhL